MKTASLKLGGSESISCNCAATMTDFRPARKRWRNEHFGPVRRRWSALRRPVFGGELSFFILFIVVLHVVCAVGVCVDRAADAEADSAPAKTLSCVKQLAGETLTPSTVSTTAASSLASFPSTCVPSSFGGADSSAASFAGAAPTDTTLRYVCDAEQANGLYGTAENNGPGGDVSTTPEAQGRKIVPGASEFRLVELAPESPPSPRIRRGRLQFAHFVSGIHSF